MSEDRMRIAVVQPSPTAPGRRVGVDPATALRRLGDAAQIQVLEDPQAARPLVAGAVDLFVLDLALGEALAPLVTLLRDAGPRALAVGDAGEATARRVLGAGAWDCVAAGPGFAERLCAAALEKLRRRRRQTRGAGREAGSEPEQALRLAVLERTHEIQSLSSALLAVDADGRIRFANPMAERLLDTEPDGLAGREIREFLPEGTPQDHPLLRSLAEGVRYRGAEGLMRRSDGVAIPVGISCAPLAEPGSGASGAVAVLQDLSELKQLQRQVLQSEKMASIGQLAAGVAHEINNPMGFVQANLSQMAEYLDDWQRIWERTDALRKAAREDDPRRLAEAVEGLDRVVAEVDADFLLSDFGKAIRESLEGAERIRHIVQDLRAFSHQDTDESVEADLNQCLDSTANIVWTMMKHSVVLTKDYSELPPVRCRPMQLKQVFMNLLVNAYQAIEARGEAARGEIRLRTGPRAGGVRIRVEDNGTGIAPEHLDRIFDPFFTTKEVGVGTGLGLSTCFTLVRRHGGTLHAESELGRGSAFEVWLPLDGRSREQEPTPA